MNLVLLGPPGAGKGTQAAQIIEKYHIPHISTGDIFRENIKNETELGKKAQEYISKGQLVPRTVQQAEALDKYLGNKDSKVEYVLDIQVEKETLIDRLITRRVCRDCGATYNIKGMPPKKENVCDKCGGELYQRADDNEETVNNRIDVYNTQTKPLLDYYEKAGNIVHLDGEAGLAKLFESIVSVLGD